MTEVVISAPYYCPVIHAHCIADARFVSARDVIHDTIEEFNVDSKARPSMVGLSAMSLRGHVKCCRYTRALYRRCQPMDVGQPSILTSIRRRRNFCGLVPDIACAKLGGCGPTINLGTDTIKASGHVRLLGVIMSSDLSLEKHVSVVSAACFFHLRQIRRIRQSLDAVSSNTRPCICDFSR